MDLLPCPHCGHKTSHLADACLECGHELVDGGMRPAEIVMVTLVISTLLFIIYFMTAGTHDATLIPHAQASILD